MQYYFTSGYNSNYNTFALPHISAKAAKFVGKSVQKLKKH